MASAIVLDGPPSTAKPKTDGEGCRCILNGRTKRSTKLCPVPKSKKHRSGWVFTGPCR